MRKLICDRCGKEIDIHPKATCRIFGNKNSGIIATAPYSETDDLEFDLCENCTNELVAFLKG